MCRPQRIERVLKCLKTKRRFVTLVEQLKAMNSQHRVQKENYIMVPAHPSVRSPVLLFIGGGMGAGKSTVVQEHILKRCSNLSCYVLLSVLRFLQDRGARPVHCWLLNFHYWHRFYIEV